MFEYVKDIGLKPRSAYAQRKKTDLIILHHFATDASAKAVHLYHKAMGHKGIDYNIVIQLDGTAVWGRGIEYEGGHVRNYGPSAGMNQRSIGIACQGNFQKRQMPDVQKETLMRVIRDCLRLYPTITRIVGHGELYATACPGQYFPLSEAKMLDKPEPAQKPEPKFAFTQSDMVSRKWHNRNKSAVKAIQTALKKAGFSPGTIDGIFGKKTEAAVKAFQRARGLVVDGIVGKKTVAALCGKWTGK